MTIWSRLPILRQLDTVDPLRTVAAELAGGVIVYGTVLPWHDDQGDAPVGAARLRNWSEFFRVTPQQGAEWRRLRTDHPDALLVIAGDLNQSLGARHHYGSSAARAVLRAALAAASLTCLSDAAHEPPGALAHPPIDHVCVGAPAGEVLEVQRWTAWEGSQAGVRLSDHSAVAVTVCVAGVGRVLAG